MIRYGKALRLATSDGRDPLQEAIEEAMDLVIYLKWAQAERVALRQENETLRGLNDMLCDRLAAASEVLGRRAEKNGH